MCTHSDSQYDHAPLHHALMRLCPENSVFLCFEKRQNKLVVRNSFEETKLVDGEVTISKKWGNSKNFIEVAFSILSKTSYSLYSHASYSLFPATPKRSP